MVHEVNDVADMLEKQNANELQVVMRSTTRR
jgi:hypothetical protein